MTAVFVGSSDSYAGKSLVCIILGLKLQQEGRSVGYFKPLGGLPARVEGHVVDEDAAFIREVLKLQDPLPDLSPVMAGDDLYRRAMSEDVSAELVPRVREAYARLRGNHEVMLVGGHGMVAATGKALGLDARRLTELLECRALVVGKYESETSLDRFLAARDALGERLAGLLLNDVPADRLSFVREEVMPYLEDAGIKVFGALPHDPVLRSVSVGELADHLGAEVLCCEGMNEQLLEHFVVGAMNLESAMRYFRRTPNKAVITGGDRSDIQLAALETGSKCVVLTGGLRPSSQVVTRSQELHVPLLLSRDDTLSVVDRIEWLLGRVRIREQAKITRATELGREHLDFEAMWAALGL
ncbi:MAG TPA: phosphotransacetylase family protein [Armatimonadota bacterium]|nr:phosphotransacetylase family protein [Armatimonadota bacterium]